MKNAEEPNRKSMEFSPIDTVEDTTGNTPETVKDESQAKRTSFTERLAMMVGMKSRDAAAEEPKAEKGRTFGTVSTITTEANQHENQVKQRTADTDGATPNQEKTTPLELGELMAKLDQIDKKLKHSEEDREVIKKELRYYKHEYLDIYFNMARATEEKFQQTSDKVNATDGEREKNIKKDLQQMKQRYDAVNSQLGSLETRMDAMSRDQAERSCAIQAKLDAILRNSTSQDRLELTSWNHNGTNGNQHHYHYPGMPRVQHRGGGQSDYEKWNSKHDEWSRRFHDSQQRGTRCYDG